MQIYEFFSRENLTQLIVLDYLWDGFEKKLTKNLIKNKII